MNATANNIGRADPRPGTRENTVPHLNGDRPEPPRELPEKLYLAAKKSKTRRFHALYDKVYRMDILQGAWKQVKANRGKPGIDAESIGDILEHGEDIVLGDIQQTLKLGNYRPKPLKRVYIPKPDGRQRPLGIPTIRDRIVQAATKMMVEPIFESDFLDCSYGFRPHLSAHDALETIRRTLNQGYIHVLDADIKGYFDAINHEKLLGFVQQRISDRRILKLIRQWLKCGVIESGQLKPTELGTPQGGVISPLLANIYLHEFDKAWRLQNQVRGHLVRYADDFVILFRSRRDADRGLLKVKDILSKLGLELHPDKTMLVDTGKGKEGFDFLGFHHRMKKSPKYHRYYCQKHPSHKAMNAVRAKIRGTLSPRGILKLGIEEVVKLINPLLRGWMNYFRFGNSSKQFSHIDMYVHERMALWWSKKHQKRGRRWKRDYNYTRHRATGIQRLTGNIIWWSDYSNAGERRLSESRMRENLMYGLMRGGW
jgi:group II intron reverse transcriptase/maturase